MGLRFQTKCNFSGQQQRNKMLLMNGIDFPIPFPRKRHRISCFFLPQFSVFIYKVSKCAPEQQTILIICSENGIFHFWLLSATWNLIEKCTSCLLIFFILCKNHLLISIWIEKRRIKNVLSSNEYQIPLNRISIHVLIMKFFKFIFFWFVILLCLPFSISRFVFTLDMKMGALTADEKNKREMEKKKKKTGKLFNKVEMI